MIDILDIYSGLIYILHFIFWIEKQVLAARKFVIRDSIKNTNYINLEMKYKY